MIEKICPRCGASYFGIGAISRKDNKTEICSFCGTEEAMLDFLKYKITCIDKNGDDDND